MDRASNPMSNEQIVFCAEEWLSAGKTPAQVLVMLLNEKVGRKDADRAIEQASVKIKCSMKRKENSLFIAGVFLIMLGIAITAISYYFREYTGGYVLITQGVIWVGMWYCIKAVYYRNRG